MQVANIPIQQVQKPTPQQSSEQAPQVNNDFHKALTKKLEETSQPQQATPNGVEETLDEAQNLAGEVIQIAITPAMMPLMQVFSETGGEQPVNAVTAVPTEVSPNILAETAELPVTTTTTEVSTESQTPNFEQSLSEISKMATTQESTIPVSPEVAIEGDTSKKPVQGKTTIEVANPEQSVPLNEPKASETKANEPKASETKANEPKASETKANEPKASETISKADVDVKTTAKQVNLESTKETVVASEVKPNQAEIKLEQVETKPITTQATEVIEVAQTAEAPEVEQAKPVSDTPDVKPAEVAKDSKVEVKLTDAKADNSSQKGEQDKDSSAKSEVEHTVIELGTKRNLVKISDSSAQLDAKPISSPQEQLVSSIKQNLVEGKTEYEMQLTPLNLGKITVKLTSENGALSVEFHAENPKTQALLNASAGEIRELLQGSQSSTTQVVTPNHSEQAQQNYTQQETKQEQQQQNQQNQNKQAEQSENSETSTVDFLSILQQLKEQSRLARI